MNLLKECNENEIKLLQDIGIELEDKEYSNELEDENLKLRIENAYLKELRRLRLEEEALLKKQRESSTVSEDSLN